MAAELVRHGRASTHVYPLRGGVLSVGNGKRPATNNKRFGYISVGAPASEFAVCMHFCFPLCCLKSCFLLEPVPWRNEKHAFIFLEQLALADLRNLYVYRISRVSRQSDFCVFAHMLLLRLSQSLGASSIVFGSRHWLTCGSFCSNYNASVGGRVRCISCRASLVVVAPCCCDCRAACGELLER